MRKILDVQWAYEDVNGVLQAIFLVNLFSVHFDIVCGGSIPIPYNAHMHFSSTGGGCRIWVVLMFEDPSLSLTLWLGHKDTGMKLPAVVLRLFSCLDRLLPKVPGVLIPLKLQVTAPDLVVQPGTL